MSVKVEHVDCCSIQYSSNCRIIDYPDKRTGKGCDFVMMDEVYKAIYLCE